MRTKFCRLLSAVWLAHLYDLIQDPRTVQFFLHAVLYNVMQNFDILQKILRVLECKLCHLSPYRFNLCGYTILTA